MSTKRNEIEQLLAYVRGQLSETEAEEIRALLNRDPELADLKQLLERLEEEAAGLPAPELTPAVRALADRLMRGYSRNRQSHDREIGVVLFDSRDLPLPEGVRPAVVDGRRLRGRIGEREVMLSVYPVSAESFEVIGQIEYEPETVPPRVSLRGRRRRRATVDRHGVFRFASVSAGPVTFVFEGADGWRGELTLQL